MQYRQMKLEPISAEQLRVLVRDSIKAKNSRQMESARKYCARLLVAAARRGQSVVDLKVVESMIDPLFAFLKQEGIHAKLIGRRRHGGCHGLTRYRVRVWILKRPPVRLRAVRAVAVAS